MSTQHLLCVVAVLAVILQVNAHTYLSSVSINGVKQTNCLRPLGTNSPISSVTSPDMMCGFLPQGNTPATSKCTIAAGSKIGLQWNHDSTDPSDDIVDGSHKGPCLVYLSSDNGASWFKIYEDGYDTTSQEFCVTKLIANKGYMEATIPADIAPGNYLMRAELIALHEAYKENGAQPYVDCTELTITGGGSAKPKGVAFPGAYSPTDPGILVNIYNGIASYTIPGPTLYKAGTPTAGGADDINGSPSNTDDSGGMSSGGKAAVALIIIALVAGVVVAGFFYKKNGHLFGYTLSGKKESSYTYQPRTGGDYAQYVDKA